MIFKQQSSALSLLTSSSQCTVYTEHNTHYYFLKNLLIYYAK